MSWRYAPWSTRLVRFQKPGQLAAEIREKAAVCSVEDLLKLTQGAIHRKNTPTQQVAHVTSSLGDYHLHLGPETQG